MEHEPSKASLEMAEELWATALLEERSPTTAEIAVALDVARAAEYKEAARAGIRGIVSAQLEVIAQCIDLVERANKSEVVTPGKGPRMRIGEVLKAMEREHARLKGMENYVPPERVPLIVEPTAAALPKGKLRLT